MILLHFFGFNHITNYIEKSKIKFPNAISYVINSNYVFIT